MTDSTRFLWSTVHRWRWFILSQVYLSLFCDLHASYFLVYQEIFVYVNISNSHGRNIFFICVASIYSFDCIFVADIVFFYAVLLARVLIYSLLVVRQTSQLQVLSSHHQSGGVWRINKCQVKCETFSLHLLMVIIISFLFIGAISIDHLVSCVTSRSYQLPLSGCWWDKSR